MRLQDRIAIVTGAASGFGSGIARRFVAEGARVLLVDRDADTVAATAAALGMPAHVADISDATAVAGVAQAAMDRWGRIDVLVNNAGRAQRPGDLDAMDPDEFDALFAVNARSVYLTARAIVPQMKRQRSGAILNIASTGAVSPRPGLTWYNASKGWMVTATRAMAAELAPWQVRVNAINPVAGDTPMLATFLGDDPATARERFIASIPLGRLSTPTDIGAGAAFLCSDDAAMITGIAMEIDGGRCI